MRGKNVVEVPPYARNIGMLFQDYALFPHMSVAENVGFPLEARGISKPERTRRVSEILEIVGLASFGERYPRQLSGGQQQRVALARALVFNPDLVLLDEPMAALDKKLRATMQLEIMRIAKQVGATVISVTHDQEEALVMSDRIALFDRGALIQIGSPRDLYESPKTAFVADFIGDANLLDGVLMRQGDSWRIEGKGWSTSLPSRDSKENALADRRNVSVILRPERIKAIPSGSDSSPINMSEGVLREKIYLGVEYRMLVELPGNQTIQVRDRDIAGLAHVVPGDKVRLTWSEHDVVVLQH
jgi:putative spermidine/putrescine transport system ATP-binding protein